MSILFSLVSIFFFAVFAYTTVDLPWVLSNFSVRIVLSVKCDFEFLVLRTNSRRPTGRRWAASAKKLLEADPSSDELKSTLTCETPRTFPQK